jgi:hypothetical protein
MGDIISQEFVLEGRVITTASGGITGPRARRSGRSQMVKELHGTHDIAPLRPSILMIHVLF